MPLTVLRRDKLEFESEFAEAARLAAELQRCMEAAAMRTGIDKVHQLGSTSQAFKHYCKPTLQS